MTENLNKNLFHSFISEMPKIGPELKILMPSVFCLIVAQSLSGGSLAKNVKWSLYNSETYFCYPTSGYYRLLSAYQTLWTSYDRFTDDKVNYGQVYQIIKKDEWRELARILIFLTIGIGTVSLVTLLSLSLVPYLKKNTVVINTGRIISSVISIANGVFLAYTLRYYHEQYQTLKSPTFVNPRSCYPDEDNLSSGFYMALTSCLLYFISSILNIVNAVKLVYDNKNKSSVVPMNRKDDETSLQLE